MLASSSLDGTIIVWDPKERSLCSVLEGHTDGVTVVRWAPNGQMLASAGRDGTIRIWHAYAGIEVRMFNLCKYPVESVAWSPTCTYIASHIHSDVVIIINLVTCERKMFLKGAMQIQNVAWSPCGRKVMTIGYNNMICIYNRLGEKMKIYQYEPGAHVLSPDGLHKAVKLDPRGPVLIQACGNDNRRECNWGGVFGSSNGMAWSPDSSRVFAFNDYDASIVPI
jgi:WD40 repeat protein